MGVSQIVLGHQKRPTCVAIQSMHHAGPGGATQAAQLPAEVVHQSSSNGPRPMSPGRMDDHAGRLVDDRKPIVFVKNLEGDILRFGGLPRDFRQYDRDALTKFEAISRLATPIVHANPACCDNPPKVCARILRKVVHQELIKSPACLGRAYHKLYRLVGEVAGLHTT